jgi:hypothetical protein
VDWKKAILLSVITTASAPVGAYLGHFIPHSSIWYIYLASVTYLAYQLFTPAKEREGKENFTLAMILAVPISILAGLLGIGPGSLLIPTLIILGFETKNVPPASTLLRSCRHHFRRLFRTFPQPTSM